MLHVAELQKLPSSHLLQLPPQSVPKLYLSLSIVYIVYTGCFMLFLHWNLSKRIRNADNPR